MTRFKDHRLARMAARGSDEAFEALAARHRPRLVAFARRIVGADGHDAEDVVQDALLKALQALRRGTVPQAPKAWLMRIVRNCAIDLLDERKRGGGPALELDEERQLPTADDPHGIAVRSAAITGLVGDIGRLPTRQRDAIVLRELEGRRYDEIAGELGVTVPAVKSLLVRARAGLKDAATARAAFSPLAWIAGLAKTAAAPKLAVIAAVAVAAPPAALVSTGAVELPRPHQEVGAVVEGRTVVPPPAVAQAAASAQELVDTDALGCADSLAAQYGDC